MNVNFLLFVLETSVSTIYRNNTANKVLEYLPGTQSHLKIRVDFLFSLLHRKKKRHDQERGPGILCDDFIILQCPLDRVSQHYESSA